MSKPTTKPTTCLDLSVTLTLSELRHVVSALGLRAELCAKLSADTTSLHLGKRYAAEAAGLRRASVKLRLTAEVWNSRQSGGLIDLGLAGCKLSKGKEQDDGEP